MTLHLKRMFGERRYQEQDRRKCNLNLQGTYFLERRRADNDRRGLKNSELRTDNTYPVNSDSKHETYRNYR